MVNKGGEKKKQKQTKSNKTATVEGEGGNVEGMGGVVGKYRGEEATLMKRKGGNEVAVGLK